VKERTEELQEQGRRWWPANAEADSLEKALRTAHNISAAAEHNQRCAEEILIQRQKLAAMHPELLPKNRKQRRAQAALNRKNRNQ
jgi:hypothetical protein